MFDLIMDKCSGSFLLSSKYIPCTLSVWGRGRISGKVERRRSTKLIWSIDLYGCFQK